MKLYIVFLSFCYLKLLVIKEFKNLLVLRSHDGCELAMEGRTKIGKLI